MKRKHIPMVICLGMLAAMTFGARPAHTQDTPQRIEIIARRFAYEPSGITLKKGQPVVLVIKSMDTAHGLHFEELDLNVAIAKNSAGELSFTPDKAGDFIGHCSVFCGAGHGGMALTLHVVD